MSSEGVFQQEVERWRVCVLTDIHIHVQHDASWRSVKLPLILSGILHPSVALCPKLILSNKDFCKQFGRWCLVRKYYSNRRKLLFSSADLYTFGALSIVYSRKLFSDWLKLRSSIKLGWLMHGKDGWPTFNHYHYYFYSDAFCKMNRGKMH